MFTRNSVTVPIIKESKLRQVFLADMPKLQQKICRQLIDDALIEYRRWQKSRIEEERQLLAQVPRAARKRWIAEAKARFSRRDPENTPLRMLVDFCAYYSRLLLGDLEQLNRNHADFRARHAAADTISEQRSVILDAAASVGSSSWISQIRDRRAIKRWMSEDAVHDRFVRRIGKTELQICFLLDRYGQLLKRVLQLANQYGTQLTAIWKRLDLDSILSRIVALDVDPRVHAAALRALHTALADAPKVTESFIDESNELWVGRAATSETLDPFVQAEAIQLLRSTSPKSFESVVQWRLKKPCPGDDIFVRRRAVRLALESLSTEVLTQLIPIIEGDSSVFVRQQFAESLWGLPRDLAAPASRRLLTTDPSPKVKAACLVAILKCGNRPELRDVVQERLTEVLTSEQDEFVLRTALHASVEWTELQNREVLAGDQTAADSLCDFTQVLNPILHRMRTTSESMSMRRWATDVKERIRVVTDTRLSELADTLQSVAKQLPLGRSRMFSKRKLRKYSDDEIGRTLAFLVQDDFGIDLDRGLLVDRMTRGHVFGIRLWRIWYEFRSPSTEKRQAFRHTIGRIGQGRLRAPSRIMAELSPTKVPGEPLFLASEGTWRPYLPLPDDFVTVANQSLVRARPFKFYTSEGVTTVRASANPVKRISAACRLTFQFAELANLRNWEKSSTTNPGDYITALRKLGFRIEFQPYETVENTNSEGKAADNETESVDNSVMQLFGITSFFVTPKRVEEVKALFYEYAVYFSSSFENSLEHLMIFATLLLLLCLGKHLLSNISLAAARRRIPISIGGWGTRGKSGTERLKAAVLGGMGHGLISKTTGCEAMFIHADPFGDPLEIPLFRPYDKATIWEQRNLLVMTGKIQPSAFLWECMGLTPSYVDVLQRQWTCDDLGTITNTFPDHEDLQGPAGYNVATTISGFAPRKAHLITTEQQMRPLVAESCRQVKTSLEGVGWLESGLIADDILSRFPYAEHPDNIALVARMAAHLGCEHDFCLKVMADYLVADLGVLKTYPVSIIDYREIEFTNGMSANERFGCLGNWKRTRFADQDPHAQRDVWLSTVVNNRADRVARSRVFAHILVDDISADRHFLIGNNLKGLLGFIDEAWQERASKISLCHGGPFDQAAALEAIDQAAKEFRQPASESHVAEFLSSMLQAVMSDRQKDIGSLITEVRQPDALRSRLEEFGIGSSLIDSIHKRHREQVDALAEIEELRALIDSHQGSDCADIDRRFRETAGKWFHRKLIVIDNYTATGEQIIRRIVDETPPGVRNRVMGVQNIKGTGLDFIYRFQAWAACHEACELLRSNDVRDVQKGLQALSLMPQFGQLCGAEVESAINMLETSQIGRLDEIGPSIEAVKMKISQSKTEIEEMLGANDEDDAGSGRFGWLVSAVEEYMEINDAVKRRNTADRVYADLAAERISRYQAVEQIRKINKRQKGGWLSDQLARMLTK